MLKKILLSIGTAAFLLDLSGCMAMAASGAVATTASVAHDRRSAGTIVDDKGLEFRAFQAIHNVPNSLKSHVSAVSYNNNILLVGQVTSDEQRAEIENSIRNLEKVRRIYNEIAVSTPTQLPIRSKDAWISTKIKSNLLFNDLVDGSRIKVCTEDGVVYLMGIVNTAEEEHAVEVARHVDGVKKVVKLFEYTS